MAKRRSADLDRGRMIDRERRLRIVARADGQALILAIIVLAVLFVSALAVGAAVTSTQHTSANDKQGARSLSAAEAGLTLGANWVTTNDADGSKAVSASGNGVTSIPGDGSNTYNVSWIATKTSSNEWTVQSTSVSSTGVAIDQRVVQEKLTATTTPGSNPPYLSYGLVMGGDPYQKPPTGGYTPHDICENGLGGTNPTRIENGAGVTVPVWIKGDLCTSGGSAPAIGNPAPGSPITVHIGGFVYGSNGPDYIIGLPTNKVATMDIAPTGCYDKHYNNGTANFPGCDYDGVHPASSGYSGVFAQRFAALPPVTPPTLDDILEKNAWLTASPGPKNPCSTTLVPANMQNWPAQLFDTNASGTTGPDSSLGSRDFLTLLGSNQFDCKTTAGELMWTPPASGGQFGTLKVIGKVFIDGSLTMGSSDLIKLDPATQGTLYIDGSMFMNRNASICANQTGTCDPQTDGWTATGSPILGLSIYNRGLDGGSTAPSFDMTGDSIFEGDAVMRGEFFLDRGAENSGSIFAAYADIVGDGHFQLTTVVPQQFPGTGGTTANWAVADGSWRQCPASAGCGS